MTNLRKTFNQSFDELRESFAGLDAHSSRVVEGIELVGELQNALYSYILNSGPKPCLTFENAPYGHPESIHAHPESDWPRVVQQQNETAQVHQLTTAEVPSSTHTVSDPYVEQSAYDYESHERNEKLRSLADRITGITQRKEAG